jgi:hypothetical protein
VLIALEGVERDNVPIRYIDGGLPTTSTAVVTTVLQRVSEGVDYGYDIRMMLFAVQNKKTGVIIHISPEGIYHHNNGEVFARQDFSSVRDYEFRECYDTMGGASEDLQRLLSIAHDHFMDFIVKTSE